MQFAQINKFTTQSILIMDIDLITGDVTADATLIPSNDSDVPSVDDLKCNQFILKNQTHFIYAGYNGIPENLLLNVICWIVSIFMIKLLVILLFNDHLFCMFLYYVYRNAKF